MRSHGAKIGFLFLALVIALGGLGVGFAAWTDTLFVQGEVNTGKIDWRVIEPNCEVIAQPQELCDDSAWALCDWEEDCVECAAWCFDCPQGWGQYFEYTIGGSLIHPLVAGQDTQIGTVSVSTSGNNVVVEYNITVPDWTLGTSHLYLKKSEPNKCSPGQFPYNSDKEPGVVISPTVHRYIIPMDRICHGNGGCAEIYVAAHANVLHPCEGASGEASVQCGCSPTPSTTPCPTPEPTAAPAETCKCETTAQGKTVIVQLDETVAGCAGEVTFYVLNTGTIPIRVTNIVINAPSGIDTTLLTPGIIGMQIHPGQRGFCSVGFEVTAPGDYTFTITVHAVSWNLY